MEFLQGIAASDGIAIAKPHMYFPSPPNIQRNSVENIKTEIQKLDLAIEKVDSELAAIGEEMTASVGANDAAIFEAHRLFLSDEAFIGAAKKIIEAESICAEYALQSVVNDLRQTFTQMEDEYFQARATDVVDVGTRLIREMMGIPHPSLENLPGTCIVIADDLTPSDTARIDREFVKGFCTARGGKTAHAAILARSLRIPAVVGVGEGVFEIPMDCTLILDGYEGKVVINPDAADLADYREIDSTRQEIWERVSSQAHLPAATSDGHQVEIVANIGSVEEASAILEYGGEGVGLLRTEFLFLERETPPSEDEQTEAYSSIAKALDGGPLIIRTLDVGGDKPLPYLPIPSEENPFLGHRGIRLCLSEKEVFKTQLRAILRTSADYNVKVMFPMVATLEEVVASKGLLEEARGELEEKEIPPGQPEVGIMVEIPSVAVIADRLASEVDFFSIGTNDLTQYTLAVDRTNSLVQSIASAIHPSVLRLIKLTIDSAHEAGIWVGLCGELAGDPLAVPVLLGIGLDEFSMASASIPHVKAEIRMWTMSEAKELADRILHVGTAEQALELLTSARKS